MWVEKGAPLGGGEERCSFTAPLDWRPTPQFWRGSQVCWLCLLAPPPSLPLPWLGGRDCAENPHKVLELAQVSCPSVVSGDVSLSGRFLLACDVGPRECCGMRFTQALPEGSAGAPSPLPAGVSYLVVGGPQ